MLLKIEEASELLKNKFKNLEPLEAAQLEDYIDDFLNFWIVQIQMQMNKIFESLESFYIYIQKQKVYLLR